ncbi:hypothetical protein, partial [Chromobacterium amazonense]|uniref:hypothetical protein n=1 Tax=Chromobacterium amazonense TaxID=1382803 RepID=UPI0021B77D63
RAAGRLHQEAAGGDSAGLEPGPGAGLSASLIGIKANRPARAGFVFTDCGAASAPVVKQLFHFYHDMYE